MTKKYILKGPTGNLAWFGVVRFSLVCFEWFGTWVMSRCFYIQKFRAPSLENNIIMDDLRISGLVWYG